MDWRRAKTILIIAFLLLDSFLAYQLWTGRGHDVEMGQQAMETSSNLQDVLRARNIDMKVEAPSDTPEMNYLNIKYEPFYLSELGKLTNQSVRIEGHILMSRFQQSLPIPDTMPKTESRKTLADHILFFHEYKYDPAGSDSGRLVYLQNWNSYPFFGAMLELRVSDDRVISYQQTHIQVVNKGSGKKVISSFTALRSLIENGRIENGESIIAVQLGYYGHTYDAEIQVLAPVWRVVLGSGQVHYVNGITGVIEKPPTLPKKE